MSGRGSCLRAQLALAAVIVLVPGAACTWSSPDPSVAAPEPADAEILAKDASAVLATVFPNGVPTLDGSGNNLRHPEWGRSNRPYSRVAEPRYADGVSAMVGGPSPRYVSNRVFSDVGQNVFSENAVTQWGFAWGQFLDHTFGLRESGGEPSPIAFDPNDPLEEFENDLGMIDFARSLAAPGTGVDSPREQINTVSSYIDAWAVYGGEDDRLEWLREGPLDGDLSNNGAHLLISNRGYLPRADARGDVEAAPEMELMGQLMASPQRAVVAGDVRANENIALTAIHTLFLREHNRIVDALPEDLPEEAKFQVARRVVMAEIQHITYAEFLPAVGVRLDRYTGYRPRVDATLSNEFAVVGYRAHSMIHGEIEAEADTADYPPGQLEALEAHGVEVAVDGEDVELAIPLNLAFGNPDLLETVGLDPILAGLGAEREYRNDEMIDNQLRSVLFQLPGPDMEDPSECLDGPPLPDCFQGVLDLGAIDIKRGRDHGMPSYNELRVAYGLRPVETFAEITGEESEEYRGGHGVDEAHAIDDPDILGFVELMDADGRHLEAGSEEADEDTVVAVRRMGLAARLKAIYGSVDRLDAFVGMLSEHHARGSELGPLQRAIWARQFQALRDGDRFFYRNDPSLEIIEREYGVAYLDTLAEVIVANSDIGPDEISANVFELSD